MSGDGDIRANAGLFGLVRLIAQAAATGIGAGGAASFGAGFR
jgi:hypothetical protein